MCINFANERLQQFFLECVFFAEELVHREEGVEWPKLDMPNNLGSLELIGKPPSGLLFILDDASRQQGAKESAFFQSAFDKHKTNACFKKPKKLRPDEALGTPCIAT